MGEKPKGITFVKKPVQIEAVLWDGHEVNVLTPWIREALYKTPCTIGSTMRVGNNVHIWTLDSIAIAEPGDYIVRGVQGELYPCKPDIFNATYERVIGAP